MTRDKEIKQQAKAYTMAVFGELDDFSDVTDGFIEGANWADKRPKRYSQEELCDIQAEMMRQRDARLFNKVCEYIKTHTWTTADNARSPVVESVQNITQEDFIKDLKRAINI